jgi:hypothetical protein
MNKLLSIKKLPYFWTLALLTIVFSFATKYFLQTDEMYYQSYAEQFTLRQIQEFITFSKTSFWGYLVYFILPIVVIIRVLFTSFCLQVGNLVQEYHWKWTEIYNISLKADVIYLFSLVGNFYYYGFFSPAKSFNDLSINFLSYLKIKGIENTQSWLVLAFNSINLFELAYVVLLILLIKTSFHLSIWKSIIFVLLTYVIGNYFYLVGMTFVYLNFAQ